ADDLVVVDVNVLEHALIEVAANGVRRIQVVALRNLRQLAEVLQLLAGQYFVGFVASQLGLGLSPRRCDAGLFLLEVVQADGLGRTRRPPPSSCSISTATLTAQKPSKLEIGPPALLAESNLSDQGACGREGRARRVA
ncbi:MAG: hypothetical protein M3116_05065, partial [Actinomycetota bacterium]|nr:hypothetical protein [Actinomycetota bacterium]